MRYGVLPALRAEVLHVNVGSEASVVGEVPARVVGVVVDDDVIGGPVPGIAVVKVVGRYAKVESAEPEAAGSAAAETPDVSTSDLAGKVSVLPRMVEVIVGVVAPSVMADPTIIAMDVRGFGMAGLIDMRRTGFVGCGSDRRTLDGLRAVCGDVASSKAALMLRSRGGSLVLAHFVTASGSATFTTMLLCECSDGTDQHHA